MVFSSIPGYVVDPPNWHQQPTHHHHQANGSDNNTQLQLPPLPPQVGGNSGGGTVGSIRPGSMADRARLAKIPPPETALKCPRCDSTNTKFCYFNNYSLSQPRHFCKTCRRYWTRGGALRNVPVGGGCRRNNKKNKSSRSKSPAAANSEKQQTLNSNSPSAVVVPSHHHDLIGQLPQPSNLPFMASLQNLNRYAVGNMSLHGQQTDHMGFHQLGAAGNSASSAAAAGMDQWRLQLQQFPFLNTYESNSAAGSYPFEAAGSGFVGDIAPSARVISSQQQQQQQSVKMEENGALNLTRSSPLTNVPADQHNQYYSWTDLSGLASSSTTHDLL